jgi:hypothetical protein
MNSPHLLLFLVTLMTTTASCQNHQRVPLPEVKRNPEPREKYLVTMVIKDAPRPFDKVEGKVQYDIPVGDDDCIPVDYTIAPGGTRNNPSEDVPVEFRKISETEYQAEIFLDALLDEDYYGLGVCRWQMTAVGVRLTSGMTIFSTETWKDTVMQEGEDITFAAKAWFDESPIVGTSHGMTLAGTYLPRDGKDFIVSFTSRRIAP